MRGTVTGFDAGVVVNAGSGNTIENLNVRDNVGPDELGGTGEWWEAPSAELGDGIVVFKSASNRIVNNVVTNNGIYDGIGISGLGSNGNLVQGNTVEDTVGIFANRSAAGTGIVINHFLDQRPGSLEGIEGNSAIGNTLKGNFGSGISSVGNANGEIVGNVAEDNGLEYAPYLEYYAEFAANGIGVQAGGGQLARGLSDMNMLVKENIASHNGFNGIFVNASRVHVEANQAFNNGVIGIYVRVVFSLETPGNTIVYNDTGYNAFFDLFDENGPGWVPDDFYCANNVWWGNTWGPVQPLAESYGITVSYYPDCTAAGGSGPNPPPEG